MKIKDFFVVSGSTLGFVATLLGIVAVFYPDLLNLQKKTITSFAMEASNKKNAKAFDEFLYKNRNEIVKLDINICETTINTLNCPKITHKDNNLSFDFIELNTNGSYSCGKGEHLEGMIFNFSDDNPTASANRAPQVWEYDRWAECSSGRGTGTYKLSHHFLIPNEAEFSQGWVEWKLTPIDTKELKLKNY